MMTTAKTLLTHIFSVLLVLSILTLGIIYPFMSGDFDRLAMPISTLSQGVGIVGIVLSAFGLLWLLLPSKFNFFVRVLGYLTVFLILIFVFFAYLLAGLLWSVFILLFLVMVFLNLRKIIKSAAAQASISFVPIYLIGIPLSILAIQLSIAQPVTAWSRDRTIANAGEYIQAIEDFKSKNGYYPKTLQAMYKDYYPQTVGVDKFHYLPSGDSYNISFEQPRFFLDIIGTKEWVVYNPKDEHRVYSHTSWFLLLSPEESDLRQGWYASSNTKHQHWKSFLFD